MNASGQFLRQSAFQAAGDQPVFRLDRVVLASGSPGFIAARSTLSSNAPACRTSRAQRTRRSRSCRSSPRTAVCRRPAASRDRIRCRSASHIVLLQTEHQRRGMGRRPAATHGDAGTLELLADRAPMNAQLGTDLAQGPSLGV
jgi:hypothetical protein